MIGYQPGPRSMAGPAPTHWHNSRRVWAHVELQSVQWTRQGTCWVVPYKVSLYFFKRYTNSVLRSIYSLSTYVVRSSNLTIGEPFFENSSNGRSHCFCAAARILLLPTGYSHLHRCRTTVCFYPRFPFFHFLNSLATIKQLENSQSNQKKLGLIGHM